LGIFPSPTQQQQQQQQQQHAQFMQDGVDRLQNQLRAAQSKEHQQSLDLSHSQQTIAQLRQQLDELSVHHQLKVAHAQIQEQQGQIHHLSSQLSLARPPLSPLPSPLFHHLLSAAANEGHAYLDAQALASPPHVFDMHSPHSVCLQIEDDSNIPPQGTHTHIQADVTPNVNVDWHR
jgi:multidrug efflux pump subunit AcrA (membrane-fusion protein)